MKSSLLHPLKFKTRNSFHSRKMKWHRPYIIPVPDLHNIKNRTIKICVTFRSSITKPSMTNSDQRKIHNFIESDFFQIHRLGTSYINMIYIIWYIYSIPTFVLIFKYIIMLARFATFAPYTVRCFIFLHSSTLSQSM